MLGLGLNVLFASMMCTEGMAHRYKESAPPSESGAWKPAHMGSIGCI